MRMGRVAGVSTAEEREGARGLASYMLVPPLALHPRGTTPDDGGLFRKPSPAYVTGFSISPRRPWSWPSVVPGVAALPPPPPTWDHPRLRRPASGRTVANYGVL